MNEIIIASKNEGKIKEFAEILHLYNFNVKSLLDFSDQIPDVEETGTSFSENAQIKAEEICSVFSKPVLADDSGLVVDALEGRPGVYSARYAGPDRNDEDNYLKVLEQLEDIPKAKRTARFTCALAIARPKQETVIKIGHCEGIIAVQPIGSKGFGYDPIFIPEGFSKTMAQLTAEEKNKISHRYHAIQKFKQWMDNNITN